MITRMYKADTITGKTKFFQNEEQAKQILGPSLRGEQIYCFIDNQTNTCHELHNMYAGDNNGETRIIRKRERFYGGNELLYTYDIKDLSDGLYHAYLSISMDKEHSIHIDKSGVHHEKQVRVGWRSEGFCKDYGLILHIENNSYTLYSKVNQFIPEPSIAFENNLPARPITSNNTFFTTIVREPTTFPMHLTQSEENYFNNIMDEAKNNAIKHLVAKRLG